jgi:hypothetical protein
MASKTALPSVPSASKLKSDKAAGTKANKGSIAVAPIVQNNATKSMTLITILFKFDFRHVKKIPE